MCVRAIANFGHIVSYLFLNQKPLRLFSKCNKLLLGGFQNNLDSSLVSFPSVLVFHD